MATSVARSKMGPTLPASARCCAVLNTFSNTRGTATTIVGEERASSSGRLAIPDENVPLIPYSEPTRAMILAYVWASGRNSRLRSSGPSIDATASRFCFTLARRLPWVSMHPLGRPVVPDV